MSRKTKFSPTPDDSPNHSGNRNAIRNPEKPNGLDKGTKRNVDSPVMLMHVGLVEVGHERAVRSGALKPQERDMKSLAEHAEAMARETRREIFNPAGNPEHQLLDAEYNKAFADRIDAENALHFSAAEVREKEMALARFSNEERPGAPILMVAITACISGTVTPTMHDFLFGGIEDEVTAWLFSFLTSLFPAATIAWAILGCISATGRRTVANWAGLVAGVIMSLARGLFRLSGAMGLEEVLMAIALTLLEVAFVLIAEWVASGLRHHHAEWSQSQTAHAQASRELEAARAEHQRRENRLNDLNDQISQHIEYVEDRSLRNINLNQLIETATKAILDGYNQGIAENRGRIITTGGNHD